MKNILKKNSIIITALAIMIVIAGYLSFTNKDAKDETTIAGADNTSEDMSDEFVETEGMNVATTNGTDTTDDTDITDTDTDDGTDTADDTDTGDDTDTADDADEDASDAEEDADTDELGDSDISDEDILANAQDVSDNGELNLEDGVPGEAVLANTADAGYFVSRKIDREQVRARIKETYMDIIESPDVKEEDKQDAIQSMIKLTDIMDKESAAEMLLEAKGFDGVVVFIVDDTANVVVNAESLTDQQLAIIEDVVKDKTDIAVEHIEITPVVITE